MLGLQYCFLVILLVGCIPNSRSAISGSVDFGGGSIGGSAGAGGSIGGGSSGGGSIGGGSSGGGSAGAGGSLGGSAGGGGSGSGSSSGSSGAGGSESGSGSGSSGAGGSGGGSAGAGGSSGGSAGAGGSGGGSAGGAGGSGGGSGGAGGSGGSAGGGGSSGGGSAGAGGNGGGAGGGSISVNSIPEGLYQAIKINVDAVSEAVQTLQGCLFKFGKTISYTFSEAAQVLVDTGGIVPRNIINFVIDLWPSFLGGNVIREKNEKLGICIEEESNGEFIKETIQLALTCVGGQIVAKPVGKVADIVNIVKEEVTALPDNLHTIGDSENLRQMLCNIRKFVLGRLGFALKVGLNGGGLAGSAAAAAPGVGICIATKVAARQPVELILSSVKVLQCVHA